VTHVNGEAVQGLLHIQVVSLIVSGGNRVTLRALPLDSTSIKVGGRKRDHQQGKMTRQRSKKKHQRGKTEEKKRRTSLFKRLSNKRAAEQHLSSPLTPSRSFPHQLSRSLSSGDSLPGSPTRIRSPRSPPMNRSSTSDSAHSTANSSQSSSPSSSTPNSPAGSSSHFNRPSTLQGLKQKLQSPKTTGSHRRKSVHNIPLSPLARTPSTSPMATSPTRSPSPLTMVHGQGHPVGISNMTQTYNPGQQQSTPTGPSLTPQGRKSITRPKSCEPLSPLLRRAFSPDRLHPSAAEKHQVHLQTHPLQRKSSLQEKSRDKHRENRDSL